MVGLLALAGFGWISCSPGEIDCQKVSLGCPGGNAGGKGGDGGDGGVGGGGSGGTAMLDPVCNTLGFDSPSAFETKFIAVKCGMSGCHQAVFPPRNLNMPSMIRTALVGVKGMSLCKNDYYINKGDTSKSFVLAKISSQSKDVMCPSGGAANSGGTRMPNSMPAVAGDRLSDDEIKCFSSWIDLVAAAK